MADTITQLTTDIQIRFPDLSSTIAERYANVIHNQLMRRLGIRETTTDISLTAGTREYDLAESNVSIKSASYIKTSSDNDFIVLERTSRDELDLTDDRWRTRVTRGTPLRFYISSAADADSSEKKIGFDPIPDTTTSGGYPIVRLYHSAIATLSGSDVLPPDISSSQVYLDGMSYLHCKATRKKEVEYWRAQYRLSLDEEVDLYRQQVRNHPARRDTSWIPGSRVV